LRVEDNVADAYWATRGRDSQLGAWASDQSRPLDSRATFEARFEEISARFEGQPVLRPPHWSGYCVWPERIEFWQDREHRLHERRLFNRDGQGWTQGLLYP
jgi:pyridoxamine 5'-phosphate oxidase